VRDDLLNAAGVFRDACVGAVAIEIRASRSNFLSNIQAAEYRYVLDFERQGLSGIGEVFTVPGAASIWRRRALSAIGGFSDRTMAEDTDATIAIRAAGWRVTAVAQASATTVVPGTLRQLFRQRVRWIWGPLQACICQAISAARGEGATRQPAFLFGALSGLHLAGFLLPLWGSIALIFGQLHVATNYAVFVLLSVGVVRLSVALWLRDGSLSHESSNRCASRSRSSATRAVECAMQAGQQLGTRF